MPFLGIVALPYSDPSWSTGEQYKDNAFLGVVAFRAHMQTMQSQFRGGRMWRLIRVDTVNRNPLN